MCFVKMRNINKDKDEELNANRYKSQIQIFTNIRNDSHNNLICNNL